MVPVSNGNTFLLYRRVSRKSLLAVFSVPRYPRRNPQKAPGYPHFTAVIHRFIHSLSAAWGCEQENTRLLSPDVIG
jgi:hypothetical protein